MTTADRVDFPVPGGADIPQAVMTQLKKHLHSMPP